MACGWRCNHQPNSIVSLLVRTVCARDDSYLQRGELSSATGLRHYVEPVQGFGEAEGDGAGCVGSVVVAVADDAGASGGGVNQSGHAVAVDINTIFQCTI